MKVFVVLAAIAVASTKRLRIHTYLLNGDPEYYWIEIPKQTISVNDKDWGKLSTAGTDVQTGLKLDAKAFTRITGLNNGAQTLTNVKTAHGTAAQNGEIVYITLASA